MTSVADFNPNGGAWDATESTLTGTGDSLTWTVNRSASGRKAVAVLNDLEQAGVDDYRTAPDDNIFDLGAGEDGSFMAYTRIYGTATTGVLAAHRAALTTSAGWSIARGAGPVWVAEFGSGAAESAVSSGAPSNGAYQTVAVTRDAGAVGGLQMYLDGVASGAAANDGGEDTTSAVAFNISALSTPGTYLDYDYRAFWWLKGVQLNAAQVAYLDTEIKAVSL